MTAIVPGFPALGQIGPAGVGIGLARAVVDTDGRALKLQAHSAGIQNRDGAGPLLRASWARWPFVARGYAGPCVANASPIRIEVVRNADNQVGFAVIARRWVVERFFASIDRDGRLAKDSGATHERVEAFLYAASSLLMLRRSACCAWGSKCTLTRCTDQLRAQTFLVKG